MKERKNDAKLKPAVSADARKGHVSVRVMNPVRERKLAGGRRNMEEEVLLLRSAFDE